MKPMTDKRKNQRQDDAPSDSKALAPPPSTGISAAFDDLFRPFDQLLQPFFSADMGSLFPQLSGARQPNVEFQDRGDHFSLTAELPGFAKDDVEVTVGKNAIELKAEKTEKDSETKGGYLSSSRSYFHQYYSLPEQVDAERIQGSMKNGVLELRMPKLAPKGDEKVRRVDLK